ncbi:MAG: signal peptidase I [[Clostridium] scindens]
MEIDRLRKGAGRCRSAAAQSEEKGNEKGQARDFPAVFSAGCRDPAGFLSDDGIFHRNRQFHAPTLHGQDIVAYFRLGKEYKPGDVIVLERPDGEEFVKRVVAVAGDTVNIQSGKVYVNGEEAKFKGTLGKTRRTGSSVEYPVVVEDKEVFVLGDNREISEDSREFGTVKTSDIKGRIIWYLGRL